VAEVAQTEALEASVEHAIGVLYLAVTNEMDEVGGHPPSLRFSHK
jgi:hypothetical protein